MFKCSFLYLSLCSLSLVCSGSVWVSLPYCLLQVFTYIKSISLEPFLLWAGQSQLSVFSVPHTCSSMSMLYLHGEHHTRASTPNVSPVLRRGKASPPLTCWGQPSSCSPERCHSLYQNDILLAHGPWSCSINIVSTRSPNLFLQSCFPAPIAPSLHWCMGLFLPKCRTLHIPLDFMKFLLTYFSSLLRFIWVAWKHLVNYPSCLFYVICKLTEGVLDPLVQIIKKDIK